MSSFRLAFGVVAAAALAASVTGCGDPLALPCPPATYGVVEGYVTGCGKPVQAHLTLRALDPDGSPAAQIDCEPDSTGWYSIPAPVGAYFLIWWGADFTAYWSPSGPRAYPNPPDTLHVSAGSTRADFRLGSLSVVLSAPAALEGRTFRVVLYSPDDPDRRWGSGAGTVSGARLAIGFPALLPGTYCARWGPIRQYNPLIWLPETPDPREAARIEVGTDVPAVYEGALPEPWTVEGSITGSWQAMHLSAPVISAITPDSIQVAQTTAGADGAYALEIPLPGPMFLQVQHSGVRRWMGGPDFASARPYAGVPGGRVEGESYAESGIECHMISMERPDQIWMSLRLHDAAGNFVGSISSNWTPAGFSGLDPGTYYLEAQPAYPSLPWAGQWYDGAESFGTATPIEVAAGGEVTSIDLVLQPAANRKGCGTGSGRVR